MLLPRDGVEYATWTLTDPPTGAVFEAQFAPDPTWHPVDVVSPTVVRVLVAGPDTASPPPGAVVLGEGHTRVRFRVTDTPEVLVRGGGVIVVEPVD